MRLRQLEYLIAICEQGSFSAAAQRLLVAQPSLSQQVRALEHELGAELLERGRHGVAVTAAGRVFLPHARNAIAAIDAARASVAEIVDGRGGELHVLTIRSGASGILPISIARWHDLYPGTVLRMHDYSHRRDLEDAVRAGRGDVAIGPRPADWDGETVSLGFESLVVAGGGPYDHDVAKVDELAAKEWVTFEPEQGMSEILSWVAGSLQFTPRAAARVGQVAAALNLAVEGVGLAVVPENAVPYAWRDRVRQFEVPLYREIVAYGRTSMAQLARRYVELLGSVELPLTKAQDVPENAVTC